MAEERYERQPWIKQAITARGGNYGETERLVPQLLPVWRERLRNAALSLERASIDLEESGDEEMECVGIKTMEQVLGSVDRQVGVIMDQCRHYLAWTKSGRYIPEPTKRATSPKKAAQAKKA